MEKDGLLSGYIPSLPDKRDYMYVAYTGSNDVLPEEFCLPKTEFFDQGLRGTCVAVAGMNMKNIQEAKDSGVKVSPEFLFEKAQEYDDLPEGSQGTTPRAALKVLKELGTPKYSTYPYGEHREITPEMLEEAYKYRIKSYLKITTVDEVKRALFYEQKPVFMGLHVSKKFRRGTIEHNGKHIGWHPYEMALGGHMILVTGYSDTLEFEYTDPDSYPDPHIKCKGFVQIKNSWADWGDSDGYAWIPYAWVERSLDIYTTSDVITGGENMFNDLSGFEWAKDDIEEMARLGILKGFPDGTFKPGDQPNRAQMAVMMSNFLRYLKSQNVL